MTRILAGVFAVIVAVALPVAVPGTAHAAPGPGGATVLTLDPAFRDLPMNWLRGELFRAPNVVANVPYNNFPGATNTHRGRDKLNEMLHSIPGRKIVVGHSQGAQVQDDWLRTYGPTSDIDPRTVMFVLTGDLEHKYNGCANQGGCSADYGGNNFPDDTRYTVKVVSRQYDYWADAPNRSLMNDTARRNRNAANVVGGEGQLRPVHNDYSMIGLNDPANKTFTEGNATYILGAPATYFLPLVTRQWTSHARKVADDARLRPEVERAYDRPMGTLPAP
ncbi:PE-PPE domain-containing protein [Gordonia sp. NPDC062954]|uniref:PE-PPE domain-containing protein n=1 Tax=Gordonia sp. NPDC062954 TaxID=3364003 RepID=UPI0037CB895F